MIGSMLIKERVFYSFLMTSKVRESMKPLARESMGPMASAGKTITDGVPRRSTVTKPSKLKKQDVYCVCFIT